MRMPFLSFAFAGGERGVGVRREMKKKKECMRRHDAYIGQTPDRFDTFLFRWQVCGRAFPQ